MADVRPLILTALGRMRQLVAGETLAWALLSSVPAFASRWPTHAEVTDKPATYAPSPHEHAAGDITSGTFGNNRISQGSVTQHQGALTINWSQLFDMGQLPTWRGTDPATKANTSDVFPLQPALGGGVDLNTVTAAGIYHQPTNAQAGSGSNYPAAVAGMLMVYSASVMTYQTYQEYNSGRRWHRSLYSGVWSAWREVGMLDGTNTWSGVNTFGTGALVVDRTTAAINAVMEYRTTWGSIFAGMGAAGSYAIGGTSNLSGSNWMLVNATGISTAAVYAGTGDFTQLLLGDAMRAVSSSGVNYLQSGAVRTTGSFQNLRFGPYGSTLYYLEVRATGIDVTGDVTATGIMQAQTGRFQSGTGTADLVAAGAGAGVRLLPNGYVTTGMAVLDGNGDLTLARDLTATRYINAQRMYGAAGVNLDLISNVAVRIFPNSSYSTSTMVAITAGGVLYASGGVTDTKGDVRDIPAVLANTSGVISTANSGGWIYSSNNSNYTWTLSGWAQGMVMTFYHYGTAGTKTLAPGAGITLQRGGTAGSVALGPKQHVTVFALTSTIYVVLG